MDRTVKQFLAPHESLGAMGAEAAAALISTAADIALVVDTDGIIRDIAVSHEQLQALDIDNWLGKPWVDTVTVESRQKIRDLVERGMSRTGPRWRQVNYATRTGDDLPIAFSAYTLDDKGWIVLIGRELLYVASIQQKLVRAQQSMERDYFRLRNVEMRYRLLFQMASDAVLIVDADKGEVLEANPAAREFMGEGAGKTFGRTLAECFARESAAAVDGLLAAVRATGRADHVRARLSHSGMEGTVSISLFHESGRNLFLIHFSPGENAAAPQVRGNVHRQSLLQLMDSAPDGFVVTDRDGRVICANAAFLEMIQVTTEEQVRGELLERWLARGRIDLNVMLASLREHRFLRLFSTEISGDLGSTAKAEISGVAMDSGAQRNFGFTIRNIERRLEAGGTLIGGTGVLPHSVQQMTELVGRVTLKDLVRETTDMIERIFIEAALEITGDNRASAAEMLGLSRQSLYVKLRRHGVGDLYSDGSNEQN